MAEFSKISDLLKACEQMTYKEAIELMDKEFKSIDWKVKDKNLWKYKDLINEYMVLLTQGYKPGGLSKSETQALYPVVYKWAQSDPLFLNILKIVQEG